MCDPNIFVRKWSREFASPVFQGFEGTMCMYKEIYTIRDKYFLVYEKWGTCSILLLFLS